MASDQSNAAPVTRMARSSRLKRLVTAAAFPVFYVLNRPSLGWLAHVLYDFALRCNGVAINFPGRHELTIGEERFLRARLSGGVAKVLFDVGANHGAYSRYLRALAPGATIYAFEPHPRSFAILGDRLGQDADTKLLNLAVSDAAGEMQLFDFAGDDGSTQASLDQAAEHLFSPDTVAHDVRVTTIDAFMAEHAIAHIDLLKIDTEGFDLAVLRGARGALRARAIGAIQFEFIPANIARHVTMRDFFQVLDGYRLYRLCMNGGLMKLARYDVKWCEIYVTQNLVALPQ